jgi:hypothetical protein
MRTSIARHREVLREAGAPVAANTFFSETPRRGMMTL